MRDPQTDLERAIEDAFSYRGNVTLTLQGGEQVEGYLFNRDFAPHPKTGPEPFVEVFLSDGSRRHLPIQGIEGVELTGEDHAAPPPTA